ncbi:hypothetical protein FRC06_008537 [Ceratobasidium sp. 370]|nr:hypothetical protein FRC06_008537 [Ceratobasidium sp. 370]
MANVRRAHLRVLPLALHIDLQNGYKVFTAPVHSDLRKVLSNTPNLQSLGLLVAPSIIESALRDLRCPFVLTRFTCLFSCGKELFRFLANQTTLEELVFSAEGRAIPITGEDPLANFNSRSLPRLESVSANLNTLSILIPGRPVNKARLGASRLTNANHESFARVLSQSTVQLDVVELSSDLAGATLLLSNDDGLLPALRRYHIQPRQLTLNLIMPKYHYPQGAELYQDHYLSILNALRDLDLDGFTRMETFEIIQRLGPTSWVTQDQPFVQEYSILETMNQTCPSIKVLNLFGLEIQ